MKIVAKPIDVIAVFREEKAPIPYKFKFYQDSGEKMELLVEKILCVETSKIAGLESFVYTCETKVLDKVWVYQLKYIIERYRWELYKI